MKYDFTSIIDRRSMGKKLWGTHIRLNLASPRSHIEEAFDRLHKYVFNS